MSNFESLPRYPHAARNAADALPRSPDPFDWHMERGTALHRARLGELALIDFEQAVHLRPADANAASACAAVLLDIGRPVAARAALERLEAVVAASAEGCCNLALVGSATGDAKTARKYLERALQIDASHARALSQLAQLSAAEGAWDEAVRLALRGMQAAPQSADAQFLLVDTLLRAFRPADALKAAIAARGLVAGPVAQDALRLRQGIAQAVLGSWDDARRSFAGLPPTLAAHTLRQLGLPAQPAPREAIDVPALYMQYAGQAAAGAPWLYARALPQLLRALLARPDAASPRAWTLVRPFAPALRLEESELGAVQAHADAALSAVGSGWPTLDNRWLGDARLRVGLLVPRLADDADARSLCRRLAGLDRARFALQVYTQTPYPDARWSAPVAALADAVVQTAHMTDAELVARIRLDALDLLIDLAIDTPDARPCVAAARAGRVQARETRGFPSSLRGPLYDYELSDRLTHHAQMEASRTPLVRLPFAGPRAGPLETSAPPATGAWTFGVAATAARIDADSFALWMRMLHAVPYARLALSAPSPAVLACLRRHAAAHALEPERLFAWAADQPFEPDLLLDPLRWSDPHALAPAVLRGVAVLTCGGAATASRGGASLLQSAALGEWIARDAREYEERGIELAREPDLAREKLRRQYQQACTVGPWWQIEARARETETAWHTMIERARRGLPPTSFDVPAGATPPPAA